MPNQECLTLSNDKLISPQEKLPVSIKSLCEKCGSYVVFSQHSCRIFAFWVRCSHYTNRGLNILIPLIGDALHLAFSQGTPPQVSSCRCHINSPSRKKKGLILSVFKVQRAKRQQKSHHKTDQPCLRFFWKVMLVGYVTAESQDVQPRRV